MLPWPDPTPAGLPQIQKVTATMEKGLQISRSDRLSHPVLAPCGCCNKLFDNRNVSITDLEPRSLKSIRVTQPPGTPRESPLFASSNSWRLSIPWLAAISLQNLFCGQIASSSPICVSLSLSQISFCLSLIINRHFSLGLWPTWVTQDGHPISTSLT